uniref:carboxylesterase n=1 Tax=Glossina pallidipes TaxID=7398 RepID=A0A1A9ZUL9_GLOPL
MEEILRKVHLQSFLWDINSSWKVGLFFGLGKDNSCVHHCEPIKPDEDEFGENTEVVLTPLGSVRGLKSISVYGHEYCSFEGVPYAEPPLGQLRFKSPVPAKAWTGIKDCRYSKRKAMQKNSQGVIEGSEDCLYLNIFSKDVRIRNIILIGFPIHSKTKLPVMVWIHGGGFSTGSCIKDYICGPDYFMMEDLVLVTFNYRLSMFGFLSLCDPSVCVPGNAGLKDQVLALKWIKNNISYFGGDSNCITLFGQDAGAVSVHFMLSTDRACNLFHKAICQSGCMLNDWAISYDAIEMSYLLACRKGYKGCRDDDICILKFLQSVPAEKLIDIDDLDTVGRYKGYFSAFMPSIEPYESDDSIIAKPIWELIRTAWGNNVPLIVGATSFEGLCMYPVLKKIPELLERLKNKWERLLPNDVTAWDDQTKLIDSLMAAHCIDSDISRENMCALLDYYSYRLFLHGIHRFLLSRCKYAKADTYQYRFDYSTNSFNHHRMIYCGSDVGSGVAHGDDLSYLFYSYYTIKPKSETCEYAMIKRMIKTLTAFAKTSSPNCEYICNWSNICEAGIQRWLNMSADWSFVSIPQDVQEKFAAWDNLYGEYLVGERSQILKTPQGMVQGLKLESVYGDTYYSFEGIPYAEPPVGKLRFKSPVPSKKWFGVRDCCRFTCKAIQKNQHGAIEGTEDCLYLNVYSKNIHCAKRKLPVMVWIHGGGFTTGSGIRDFICGPDYFMMENIVLVTFNYRLSMFGFLSLSDPCVQVPGNAGLKDQMLAIRWVKDNICYFGGDSENITLFGQDAGGASVHYLLSSEHARDLFQKAIIQSGCFLHEWALSYDAVQLSYLLACRKGYRGSKENDECILKYLQSVPAEILVDIDDLDVLGRYKGYLYAFLPSVEPYESEDSIITKSVWDLIKTGWGNNIPVMIGGTSFEGLCMYPILKKIPELLERLRKKRERLLPNDIPCGCDYLNLTEELISAHFRENQISEEDILPFLDYYSYRLFWHGMYRLLQARSKYGKASTYLYCFDFDSPTFNHHRTMYLGNDVYRGVAHGDDLSYLFFSCYSAVLDTTAREYFMIKRMVRIWSAFAKNSNPNCEYVCTWDDISTSGLSKWMSIACELRFIDIPADVQEKFKIWNNLYGSRLIE